MGPLGTWQGVLNTGLSSFRVALVLERDPDGSILALFNNIDDGLYNQTFQTFYVKGRYFHGELPTGEKLDLALSGYGFGNQLSGTYTQARGSFQKAGNISELVLSKGGDYLVPRFGKDSRPETGYAYREPSSGSDGWEVGPVSGDAVVLNRLGSGIRRILDGSFPHIHSLLVVKGGRLVVEEYFYGYGPRDLHPVQSITKSISSLLVGIALERKGLGVDQPLYQFFPEYRSRRGWDSRKDKITLETILTMRSGFRCDDWRDSQSCSWDMVNSPDWNDFTLSMPLASPPGHHFAYCGACLTPLSSVLSRESGMSLPAFAGKFLFGPLGITDFTWMEGPRGVTPLSFGLSLRPRDLAKLGQLILEKGIWKGNRVVPEDWLDRSTSVQVARNLEKGEADYGYLWWIRTVPLGGKNIRVIDGWGVGGNHLFIVPDLGLVCVITAGNYKDGKLGANSLKLFQDCVLGL